MRAHVHPAQREKRRRPLGVLPVPKADVSPAAQAVSVLRGPKFASLVANPAVVRLMGNVTHPKAAATCSGCDVGVPSNDRPDFWSVPLPCWLVKFPCSVSPPGRPRASGGETLGRQVTHRFVFARLRGRRRLVCVFNEDVSMWWVSSFPPPGG